MRQNSNQQQANARKSNEDSIKSKPCFDLSSTRLARFKLAEKIGAGSFGQIYKAFDTQKLEHVALKFENHSKGSTSALTLWRETKVLSEIGGALGIPRVYCFTKEENFSVLVLELLGLNLEKLLKRCGGKFSLKTTLQIADQMLKRVEYVHACGFLHRDIKPENFVIGNASEDPRTIYLIDFGLSRIYIDPVTGKHIPYRDNKGLVGTARYASLATHRGVEQSRRDDLESIGYLLIYFMKGSLPWQNMQGQNKAEKYKMIAEVKAKTSIEELCHELPKEFESYMDYVKKLDFDEKPDYKYLRGLFQKVMRDNNWTLNYNYDWNINFRKFEDITQKLTENIDTKKPTRNAITNDLRAGNKTNARINVALLKDSTAEELGSPEPLPKQENQQFGLNFLRSNDTIQGIQNHNPQRTLSTTKNIQGVPNVNLRSSFNPSGNLKETVLEPVSKINLSKKITRENKNLKFDLEHLRIDPNIGPFDNFIGTYMPPVARGSCTMQQEKPVLALCYPAQGERDTDSILLSSRIPKPSKPAITFQRGHVNSKLKDVDTTSDDINERISTEAIFHQYPKIFSVRGLQEARNFLSQKQCPSRVTSSKVLHTARTLNDCGARPLNLASNVSTGTENQRFSLFADV